MQHIGFSTGPGKNPTGRRGPKTDVAIDAEVEAGPPSRTAVYSRRHREKVAAEAVAEGPWDFVVDPFVFGDPDPPQPPQPNLPFEQSALYILKLHNRGADAYVAMFSVLANSDIVIVELYRMPLVRGSDAWCFRGVVSAALLAPFRVDIRLLQPQSEDSPFPVVHARLVDGLPDEIRRQFVLTLRVRLTCSGFNEMTYVNLTNRSDVYEGSNSDILKANEGMTNVADCAGCGVKTTHSIDHMKIKTPPSNVLVVYIKPTHNVHTMAKPPPFYHDMLLPCTTSAENTAGLPWMTMSSEPCTSMRSLFRPPQQFALCYIKM